MSTKYIVAFHGFMGVGSDFTPFATACGLDIQAPDLIGHGAFQCTDSNQYRLDSQLAYWSDRIPKGSVLIGYSMGGRLALQFACRYPEHLSGLVLIGATPGLQDDTARSNRQTWDHKTAERIRQLGVERFYNEWQKMPIIETQKQIENDIKIDMRAHRLAQSVEGLANSMTHFGTGTMPSCWDALSDLTLPTLLMVGENDVKYLDIARQMLARLPEETAECAIILGSGHCAHLEQISQSAGVLKKWLKSRFSWR